MRNGLRNKNDSPGQKAGGNVGLINKLRLHASKHLNHTVSRTTGPACTSPVNIYHHD